LPNFVVSCIFTMDSLIRHIFLLVVFISGCLSQVVYVGYVYDNYCLTLANGIALDGTKVKTGAHIHSVGCMLEPMCKSSGFVVLKSSNDGNYSVAYNLSASSWTYVISWLSTLPSSRKNLAVKVTGTIDSAGALGLASQSGIADAQISYTGYLYDNRCWTSPDGKAVDGTLVKKEAHLHTIGCMLIPDCFSSGFSILKQTANSNGNGFTYSLLVELSTNATTQNIIASFLQAQKSVRSNQVVVQATGFLDPASRLVVASLTDAYTPATTPMPSTASVDWSPSIFSCLFLSALVFFIDTLV
jgi:hypothetical protein